MITLWSGVGLDVIDADILIKDKNTENPNTELNIDCYKSAICHGDFLLLIS